MSEPLTSDHQLPHCDCIKTPGALRGIGAWCKDHRRLLEDYEFQKAKADEVVRRNGELEAEIKRLREYEWMYKDLCK